MTNSDVTTEVTAFYGAHITPSIQLENSFPAPFAQDGSLLNQVDRILRSEELRGSEVLRRLLRFLADKSVSGEADELKEYIVAIDGLGKPSSYDPRHNSAVRIQVGRLRQKLADYYRDEGRCDPVVIDVPKGHFKLKYEFRATPAPARTSVATPDQPAIVERTGNKRFRQLLTRMRFPAAVAGGVLLALAVGAAYNWLKPANAKATSISNTSTWNADMEELWRPFIATSRPMIVAIEDPLFVELDGRKGVYYRDKTLNDWHDVSTSPTVAALRGALKNSEIAPSRYYTAFGEVDASFLIARMLGSHVQNLSVVKTTDLSMSELSDNNVVFVGIENIFFTDQIQAAPLVAPLQPVHEGIRNLNPGPHEPALFVDQYSTAPSEEGAAYALITHLPGPLGGNDVESFTSNRSAGYVAAVKAFTDPELMRTMVRNLKQAGGGQMPRYYQVLLKVKFKAEVPTQITYVLARELRYPASKP
jgi:hypothetical protein